MSQAIRRRETRGKRLKAWAILRAGATLWLVFYLAYTPIHVYLEPHSDEADFGRNRPWAGTVVVPDDETQRAGGHHDRHPAAQHKFKGAQSERPALGPACVAPVVQAMDAHQNCPQSHVFGFSGLSPPGLSCGWQFLFRAALPGRAPCLPS